MHKIYLALGSNIGDLDTNIKKAIDELKKKIKITKVAKMYSNKAKLYLDQPDFLNTAIEGETELSPSELLTFCKGIEHDLGRKLRFRWGPREIDIDIVFYDDIILSTPELIIPHIGAHERDFVLVPLNEISPDYIHPYLQKSIKELLEELEAGNEDNQDQSDKTDKKTTKQTISTIAVKDIEINCIIGLFDYERKNKQLIILDAEFWVDISPAIQTDNWEEIVSYTFMEDIIKEVEKSQFKTIEKLSYFIANSIKSQDPRILSTQVKVSKPEILDYGMVSIVTSL